MGTDVLAFEMPFFQDAKFFEDASYRDQSASIVSKKFQSMVKMSIVPWMIEKERERMSEGEKKRERIGNRIEWPGRRREKKFFVS